MQVSSSNNSGNAAAAILPGLSTQGTKSSFSLSLENSIKSASDDDIRASIARIFTIKSGEQVDTAGVTDLKRINEKEMYASLVHHSLREKKPGLADKFLKRLGVEASKYKEERGDHLFFKAADRVMRHFLRKKKISHVEYKEIRNFAFGKSQFDSERTKLSTEKLEGAKSGDTPLRAVKTALGKAKDNSVASESEIQSFRADQAKISRKKWREERRLNRKDLPGEIGIQESVQTSDVPPGFIWKPQSESDGRLVVLLPSSVTGKVESVRLLNSDASKVLESARFSGIANGYRGHYRFSKNGGSYLPNTILEVVLAGGEHAQLQIKAPGERLSG